ncbi:MAG: NVEALA domain-containing protein [Prevotellaceae bacterium]|nr:NVEALA domain-containing protein [Prevotellaceae bacterium]
MKRKILFICVFFCASAFVIGVYSVQNKPEEYDLFSQNVEALSRNKDVNLDCYWQSVQCVKCGESFESCTIEGDGNSCNCGLVTRPCKCK